MPNPAITESPEYQDQFQTEQPVNPVSKTQELISKYFNTKEEAPVLNQAKVERLQKMGRINTLGRGLNVLGDGISLALGANVKRKAPDTTAPALYQSYENTLDQHTQEVKGYKQRQFQKSLNDIQFGIGRLDKETDQDYRERVQKANNEFKKVKNAQDLAKWQLDYDINKGKATESERHNKEMEKAAMIRANKTGIKASDTEDKPFDPVQVTDKFGKSVKLDQGQWDNLYQSAMKDADFTNGNLKAEISKYKDLPDGGVKQIARAYYDFNKTREMSKEKQAADAAQAQPLIDKMVSGGSINNAVSGAIKSTPTKAAPKTKTNWNQYARPTK